MFWWFRIEIGRDMREMKKGHERGNKYEKKQEPLLKDLRFRGNSS